MAPFSTKRRLHQRMEDLVLAADVQINGSRTWDIQVRNDNLYARVLAQGSLGFGEAYMDGWWDCARIDELVCRLARSNIQAKLRRNFGLIYDAALASLINRQHRGRAFQIGKAHYDIGNQLYQAMLDKRLTYTCGYWKDTKTLDEAQEHKLDLVCRKIGLKSGQQVLDVGCGWGSFAKFAAEEYGVRVLGITVSKEQVKLGRELCQGLPVEIRLQDYREVTGQFDHIVSLGMIEHVVYKNYRDMFEVAHHALKENGLFLLHTIGGNSSVWVTDPWIGKYIFPNSMLPSAKQLAGAAEGLFVLEDWHTFGTDYDKTLMAWHKNFEAHWGELKNFYDERFYRMWRFYLLACAGTFRARKNQLWQMVYSKNGIPGGYAAVR